MKLAIATNNGKSFIDKHFGDSEHYSIYELSSSEIKFVKIFNNTTEEDDPNIHADPKKARGVTEMLKNEGIQVVVAKVFGPNIKRIKKKFVCVLMNDEHISESLKILDQKKELIFKEWEKGEERDFINLKKN
jgi:predicted Fe-Mo cluster-binding NifX family protein